MTIPVGANPSVPVLQGQQTGDAAGDEARGQAWRREMERAQMEAWLSHAVVGHAGQPHPATPMPSVLPISPAPRMAESAVPKAAPSAIEKTLVPAEVESRAAPDAQAGGDARPKPTPESRVRDGADRHPASNAKADLESVAALSPAVFRAEHRSTDASPIATPVSAAPRAAATSAPATEHVPATHNTAAKAGPARALMPAAPSEGDAPAAQRPPPADGTTASTTIIDRPSPASSLMPVSRQPTAHAHVADRTAIDLAPRAAARSVRPDAKAAPFSDAALHALTSELIAVFRNYGVVHATVSHAGTPAPMAEPVVEAPTRTPPMFRAPSMAPPRSAAAQATAPQPQLQQPPEAEPSRGPELQARTAPSLLRTGGVDPAPGRGRLAPPPEPIRVHADWSADGVRLWLGMDAHVLDALQPLTAQLQRWLAAHGVRLISISCNGRPLGDEGSSGDGFDTEPAHEGAAAAPINFTRKEPS